MLVLVVRKIAPAGFWHWICIGIVTDVFRECTGEEVFVAVDDPIFTGKAHTSQQFKSSAMEF